MASDAASGAAAVHTAGPVRAAGGGEGHEAPPTRDRHAVRLHAAFAAHPGTIQMT